MTQRELRKLYPKQLEPLTPNDLWRLEMLDSEYKLLLPYVGYPARLRKRVLELEGVIKAMVERLPK